jgi:hypothetical protein
MSRRKMPAERGLRPRDHKVTVMVKLSDGRSLRLSQSYKGCPSGRH